MTINEASKRIGVSSSKLYQLVAARRIAHYRVDGKIIFSEDDIATFLSNCRVGSAVQQTTTYRPTPKLKHINLDGKHS